MSFSYAQHVRRFVSVSEHGSIQKAAQALNISQPALTQSIKHIEEMFECRLFERTKRGVLLTPMGEHLYRRSTRMLEELALAQAEIGDMAAGRASPLRISAGTAWGCCYLPTLIRKLQTQYTDLKIDLDIALTAQGLPQLKAGRIDALLGADESDFEQEGGFARLPLTPLDFAAGCGLASPLAKRKRVALEDFADVPIVIYQDDVNLMKQVIARIEHQIGRELEIAIRTTSLLTTLELVRDGPYVVFLAEPFLKKFSDPGICILPMERPLHRFPTAIYYRESLTHSRPFRTLLTMLEDFRPDL